MDLNQIVLFTRVVEAGSFTAAAKALGLPVSSVSRGVVHLEESLGARLLQRTTRKLSLTEAGKHFFDEATGAVGALEQAAERVADSSQQAHGTVRITLPVDLGDSFLAVTLADFHRKHPRIRVEVDLQNQRVDLVQDGFDLALRGGKMEDSSLVGRKVAETDMGLYAAQSYLELHPAPQRFADLSKHACLCFRSMSSSWTLEGPNGPETVKVSGPLAANDISLLTRSAGLGLGITLLPVARAMNRARAPFEPQLVRLLPEYSLRGGALWLLWPSTRYLPLRVALLRDHLFDAFQDMQRKCESAEHALGPECGQALPAVAKRRTRGKRKT
jgi:DNA-binding transcriptional LysR family regulator